MAAVDCRLTLATGHAVAVAVLGTLLPPCHMLWRLVLAVIQWRADFTMSDLLDTAVVVQLGVAFHRVEAPLDEEALLLPGR